MEVIGQSQVQDAGSLLVFKSLGELLPWCKSANFGDTLKFILFTRAGVSREEIVEFVRDVNSERTDHIWIDTDGPIAADGESVSMYLSVRCSH